MTRNISWNFLKSDELCLASFVSLRPASNSGSIVWIKMLSNVSDEDLLLPRDKLIKLICPKKYFWVNLYRVETSRCRRAVTLQSSQIWALRFEMAAFNSLDWQRWHLIQKQNFSPRKEAKSQLQYL